MKLKQNRPGTTTQRKSKQNEQIGRKTNTSLSSTKQHQIHRTTNKHKSTKDMRLKGHQHVASQKQHNE